MAKVYRVFAEKKKGNDIEASNMLNDLKENVGIKGIEELRIINRYDAQGLSEDEFKAAVNGVFSEPNLDNVYFELKLDDEWKYFATEFLPGQYDQRADSAAQCIQLLTAGERPEVASAKVIAVKGDITDAELDKIKAYVINPVESRLASMDKPESLDIKSDIPRASSASSISHEPSRIKVFESILRTDCSSSSYSSSISPTSSSIISSMVTSPAVPPYSSTTMAS